MQYFHIFNRGIDSRNIFLDINDRQRFLLALHVSLLESSPKISDLERQKEKNNFTELPPEQLSKMYGPVLVDIIAFCLMPNHYHLLIKTEEPKGGGGCLIATAAYGTELAPQVQFLREIRDNTVMSTESGVAFMTGFNQLYYSFSPIIADMERENPMFQEVVRAFITPMVSSLSIMTLAEDGSEVEVLGLGISVIALNLGMYIAAPALIGFKVHNHIKSQK